MVVLQPRHDPSVDTAQPCPLGRACCVAFDSWSSTNVITTVVFSARTWRWCCVGCCGCARATRLTRPTPTVIFASATTASPGATAAELIGLPVEEVTEDGSPQGARTVALWEPALRDRPDRRERRAGAPVRRCRGGARDGRPDRRGRADADVRPVAARCGIDRAGGPGAVGRHRPGAVRQGGVVSGRLSRRGPHARWSAPWPRAGCAVWPPPMRWSWVSTSPGWTRWCSPVFPGRSPRSGSRPAGRAGAARARWSC